MPACRRAVARGEVGVLSVAQPTAQARRQEGMPRSVTAAQYVLVVLQSATRKEEQWVTLYP